MDEYLKSLPASQQEVHYTIMSTMLPSEKEDYIRMIEEQIHEKQEKELRDSHLFEEREKARRYRMNLFKAAKSIDLGNSSQHESEMGQVPSWLQQQQQWQYSPKYEQYSYPDKFQYQKSQFKTTECYTPEYYDSTTRYPARCQVNHAISTFQSYATSNTLNRNRVSTESQHSDSTLVETSDEFQASKNHLQSFSGFPNSNNVDHYNYSSPHQQATVSAAYGRDDSKQKTKIKQRFSKLFQKNTALSTSH